MKICKYYSLDECSTKDEVYSILDDLKNDSKIEYEIIETDVIKIKDIGLTTKGAKELLALFNEHDVISYPDYIESYVDEDDDVEDDDVEDDIFDY